MSSWSVTIPFNPRATPRPNYRVGPRKKGKKEYGVITYYDTWYFNYLAAIDTYLKKYNLKNQDFYAILRNRCKEEICNLQGFIEAISDKWG